MNWISLRNQWPTEKGRYLVKDIRYGMQWESVFDGWNWEKFPEKLRPTKGAMIHIDYFATHWMPLWDSAAQHKTGSYYPGMDKNFERWAFQLDPGESWLQLMNAWNEHHGDILKLKESDDIQESLNKMYEIYHQKLKKSIEFLKKANEKIYELD